VATVACAVPGEKAGAWLRATLPVAATTQSAHSATAHSRSGRGLITGPGYR
jgi:hypothetical protein